MAQAESKKRIVLVTGANKGIGLGIARQLADKDFHVIMGVRDVEKGKAALAKNFKDNEHVEYVQLDLNSEESIKQAAETVAKKHGTIDVLVHNAGMAYKGDAFDSTVVKNTFAVNYYGTINANKALMPLLSKNDPRLIFVSSTSGRLSIIRSEKIRQQFLECNDFDELTKLLNEFVSTVEKNKDQLGHWPRSAYGMSKAGLSMYTRILASKPECKNIFVATVNPGYVATDMSSHRGTRDIDQGAWVVTKLATMSLDKKTPSGHFWAASFENALPNKEDKSKWRDVVELKELDWVTGE